MSDVFCLEIKHNPMGKYDIEVERECREEILGELVESMKESTMGFIDFSEDDERW